MMNVTGVTHVRGYVLHVAFSDGTEGDVDLEPYLKGPAPLAELRNPELFASACLDGGTVAWPNGADFAVEFVYALAHDLTPPRTLEQADANELTVSLRELRALDGGTRQEDVAAMLNITQGAVSQLEGAAGDAKITTLRRFVKALGWDLEVVAVKGDRRLRLRGV